MPIYDFNDLSKKLNKYRIKLDEDFHNNNIKSIEIEFNNELVDTLNENFPDLLKINNIPDIDGILLYGNIVNNEVFLNYGSLSDLNYEGIIGDKLGIIILSENNKLNSQNILESMEYIKHYNMDITNTVIILYYFNKTENIKEFSAYNISNKIYELFKEDILYINLDNSVIKSKKNIEIFEKNGVKSTDSIPIELVYKPLSIKQSQNQFIKP